MVGALFPGLVTVSKPIFIHLYSFAWPTQDANYNYQSEKYWGHLASLQGNRQPYYLPFDSQ
jgi:hypothetical protein